jgi:hypothetical protein
VITDAHAHLMAPDAFYGWRSQLLGSSSGRSFDDLKPVIEEIGSLTEEDREAVFETNARAVFSRWKPPPR